MSTPLLNVWPAARAAQKYLLRVKRREASIDGHRMVFFERGQPGPRSPTIVLVHGFAAMKENWVLWSQFLPKEWHLLVPDLPGFGESDYFPDACYQFETQAKRLQNWLSGLDTTKVHLVGSSMGGAIVAVLAHTLQPAPKSVTLLNSAGIPEHNQVDITAPFESNRDEILIPRSMGAVYQMLTKVGNGKPTISGLAMAGLLGPDLLSRTESLEHIFGDMVADAFAPARYLGVKTPPLQVQWGDRDTITPTSCSDWFITAVPHAEIHLFRGVGHLPMLEVPFRSSIVFEHFVRKYNSAGGVL